MDERTAWRTHAGSDRERSKSASRAGCGKSRRCPSQNSRNTSQSTGSSQIMPKESIEQKKARVTKIISGLQKAYPDAHCELNHSNPLELLIATILSAQCTDKRVNIVTPQLFKKYRTAQDFANARLTELEEEIKTTGFYRN